MRCKSCTNEVPPKFSHAIKTNICPFCGEEIMDSELQLALTGLQEAMLAVEEYPDEMHDWLKCNYQLVAESGTVPLSQYEADLVEIADLRSSVEELKEKLANAKPTPKSGLTGPTKLPSEIAKDKNGNALEGEALADPETNSKFFKNALVKQPVDAAQHYKNMVKKIKETGTMGSSEGGSGGGAITPEMMAAYTSGEESDPSEYNELFGGGPINSAIDSDYDDENEIPAAALQMMHSAKSQSGDYNARDVAKLQELQKKAQRAGNAMNRTGGVGLIRR